MVENITRNVQVFNTWIIFITTTSGAVASAVLLLIALLDHKGFLQNYAGAALAVLFILFIFMSIWSYFLLKKYLLIEPKSKKGLLGWISEKSIPDFKVGAYIRLQDLDVLKFQVSLVKYMSRSEGEESIDAFDLTTNPKRWFSRTQYNEEGSSFIKENGEIRRVLIIEEDNLDDFEFSKSLFNLISLFESQGVKLGMQLKEYGFTDEDFILYGNQAVMKELLQANEAYTQAESVIFVDRNATERYREKFLNTWNKQSTQRIKESFNYYMSSIDKESYRPSVVKSAIHNVRISTA